MLPSPEIRRDKMTVKDVIKDVARLLDDKEFCNALDENKETVTDENKAKTAAMLKCFNDALFEIASEYYPLVKEETFSAGKIPMRSFTKTPLKITSVRLKNGEAVSFYVGADYVETEKAHGEVTVVYEYIPSGKGLIDDFEYDATPFGKTIFAYGIAAEYCLVAGRFSEAANWESRYKNALGAVTGRRKRAGRITNKRVWK